jgi:hypothetical protein
MSPTKLCVARSLNSGSYVDLHQRLAHKKEKEKEKKIGSKCLLKTFTSSCSIERGLKAQIPAKRLRLLLIDT